MSDPEETTEPISIDERVRLAGETMKLLLQVAWADLHVNLEEARTILELANSLDIAAAQRDELGACLAGEQRLPAPDMGLLRRHGEEVVSLVCRLLASGHRLVEEEASILDEIRSLLGVESRG